MSGLDVGDISADESIVLLARYNYEGNYSHADGESGKGSIRAHVAPQRLASPDSEPAAGEEYAESDG